MKWVVWPGMQVLLGADGGWLGTAYPDGHWCVCGTYTRRAETHTLEAAKAALAAELWARAALALGAGHAL